MGAKNTLLAHITDVNTLRTTYATLWLKASLHNERVCLYAQQMDVWIFCKHVPSKARIGPMRAVRCSKVGTAHLSTDSRAAGPITCSETVRA